MVYLTGLLNFCARSIKSEISIIEVTNLCDGLCFELSSKSWLHSSIIAKKRHTTAHSRSVFFESLDLDQAFESIGANVAEWWTPTFNCR
jgi:hypothetical protein